MFMNTSPNVLERFKLLRFIGKDFFPRPNSFVSQCHAIEHKFKRIRNERRHGTGNLKKIQKTLILILKFDDVTVKGKERKGTLSVCLVALALEH